MYDTWPVYDPCIVVSFTRIVSDQSAENIAQTLGNHSYKVVFLLREVLVLLLGA